MSWTPTDEQVEKAAEALDVDAFTYLTDSAYSTTDEQEEAAEEARQIARAALVAVGPHIAAQGWDEASEWVADPHVARGLRQANPYRQEAGR